MATCKECLHYEACSGFIPTERDKAVWHYVSKGISDKIPNIEERCSTFCNKADVVEVKHGEWKLGKSGCMYFCSRCNYAAHPREQEEWHFCPNCGAKMYGKEGEE